MKLDDEGIMAVIWCFGIAVFGILGGALLAGIFG